MPQLGIIIVEKGGSLKTLTIKDYKEEELYKKCGFKKADDFSLQVEWPVKLDGQKYLIAMYGKLEGKANMENKYDFPPPVDNNLYFGSCALVGMIRDDANNRTHINLTKELWNKIYEKLFGGFEDLAVMCADDDDEEDELEKIPKSMKTKNGGYLKDGFVVDSDETEESGDFDDADDDEDSYKSSPTKEKEETVLDLDDLNSELAEEEYEYSDEE